MKTPREIAEERYELAAEYGRMSTLLEAILERKAPMWQAMREKTESDKSADRAYEATQDGINEMKLRMALKRLEKMMSAGSSLLRVLEVEARNQF